MATASISVMLSLLASDRWDVYRSSAILPLVFRGRATAEPKRAAQFSARMRNRSGGGERLDQSRVDAPVPSTYWADRLTPPAASIRDEAHRRVALPPPGPGSVAAHSATRARPSPAISVSGSYYSSRRTSTGSPADAARRLPRHGQGSPAEASQSRALRRRFATASVTQ